ncbi:MAG: DUF4405 domain-containing protein [Dysgonomonas sp.]
MNSKLKFRLLLDLAMTILILLALAFRRTGDVLHEWIGLVAIVLFVIHNIINIQWYRQLFSIQRKYSLRWLVNATINILLIIIMATMAITGLIQSKIILASLDLQGNMLLRQIHTISAYWGYLLVSVHIGMHWQMLYKHLFGKITNDLYMICIRILGLLIAISGLFAFIERDMYSKLFLGLSFDFWDKSSALFLVYHLLIIGLLIWITYYALKLIHFFSRKGNLPK